MNEARILSDFIESDTFNDFMEANKLIHLLTATEHEVEAVQIAVRKAIGTRIQRKTAYVLACIRHLLDEYSQFGKVTVRQVYYQLVSRAVIENSQRSYFNYVNHLTTGRKAEVIPWNAFEDRVRAFHKAPEPQYDISDEKDPAEALMDWFRHALQPGRAEDYGLYKWTGQPFHVELWVEKDALAGFLSPLCQELGVGLVVSRGYTSYTFKAEALERFREIYLNENRKPVLLYLGDLDPSGYDIYRCLEEEIGEFTQVKRIGLLREDVQQFGLVPCLIKEKDSRTKGFKKRFPELGEMVYELDALPPAELQNRARNAVLQYFDQGIYEESQKQVRHWRANFCDHQEQIKLALKEVDFEILF